MELFWRALPSSCTRLRAFPLVQHEQQPKRRCGPPPASLSRSRRAAPHEACTCSWLLCGDSLSTSEPRARPPTGEQEIRETCKLIKRGRPDSHCIACEGVDRCTSALAAAASSARLASMLASQRVKPYASLVLTRPASQTRCAAGWPAGSAGP
eukprot:5884460-Prymnesium_polylepis.1